MTLIVRRFVMTEENEKLEETAPEIKESEAAVAETPHQSAELTASPPLRPCGASSPGGGAENNVIYKIGRHHQGIIIVSDSS
jgi:hypothetical protein